MSEQKGSFFRRVLESGFGRTVSGLIEEVKNDSRMAAGDMRSFTSGIRSDISGVCGKFGRKASREDCKAPASEDGSGGVGELVEELGEGASALRDNANAHGEDIRRAAGIPAGQAEQEVTPEEVTESLGELAEELGEGASALRDNANAHGEDIRRAAGIPAGQEEQEVTPEEVTESLGELADELGEGASALRDNANAHGEDIRRAAGIPADRKEGA